jgi:hypothetical protein
VVGAPCPQGRGNFNQLVGDYTSPILKPQAAETVAEATGVGFQRRGAREESSMSDYADDTRSCPDPADAASAAPLSLKDFCAYAAARACIYLPCKTPWPNASVDNRLPRQPLLDSSGNPVGQNHDDPGQHVAGEASKRRDPDLGARLSGIHPW